MATLDKVLNAWKIELTKEKFSELNNLFQACLEYFHSDTEKEDLPKKKLRSKKEIVDFIMSSDPVVSEGGLLDFLMLHCQEVSQRVTARTIVSNVSAYLKDSKIKDR
jgi:hypothetical protein